jgi:transglutaminase-like putative cysteine protease
VNAPATVAGDTVRTYRVVHVTQYRYDDDVSVSYGRAHLLPRAVGNNGGQVVLASDLDVDPGADELRSHTDFFGNVSTYYAVRQSHRALRVTATSEVRIERAAPQVSALNALTWESVRDQLAGEVEARSFVLPSPLVGTNADLSAYAAATFTPGRALGSALGELVERIHADFEYVSGSTTVKTTLGEVLELRQGVCQDFAHLAVGCLRSVGLPARYVSGYLETQPPPGQPKLQGADASHAWAALRVPGMDWIDLDPTNNQFVDARYVVAGWGRDYSDVPPLKGVIMTDAKKSTLTVSVDVTRIG